MNLGIKLKPSESDSESSLDDDAVADDQPLTPASPVTLRLQAHYPHLVQCRHCRALNGLSASACWNCEAELSASRRSEPEGKTKPEVAELASVPPAVDTPPAVPAPDPLEPTPEPAVHALFEPDADAADRPPPVPAPAPEPTPFAAMEAVHPMVVRLQTTTPPPWRKRVTTAAIVLALVVGVDVYLRFQASPSDTLDAAVMSGSALMSRGTVNVPDTAEATHSGPTPAPAPTRVEAPPPVVPSPVKLATNTPVTAAEPAPRATTRTTRPARVAGRSKEARAANASGATRPPPPPQTMAVAEPARPRPVPSTPCTAAVAALGLCATPPQAKE